MAFYRYEALDKNGQSVSGALQGADENAVTQRLNEMGFTVRRVFLAPGQQPTYVPSAGAPAAQHELFVSLPPSVALRSLASTLRRLATSVRGGIPVAQAVADLAGTSPSGKMRRVMADISNRMNKGARLGEAMAAHPRIIPAHIAGLVMAGEVGGFLDGALDEAATFLEKAFKEGLFGWFIRLLWWSTLITLPFAIPLIWMPKIFVDLFEKGAADATAALAMMGGAYLHYFLRYGLPFGIILLGGRIIHSLAMKRSTAFRVCSDRVVLKIPLLGRIAGGESLARFTSTLGRLYESGVPPDSAWEISCRALPNSAIASMLYNARNMILTGHSLQSALAVANVLDADSLALVASAEQTGGIPEAMKRISTLYADKENLGRRAAQFWNFSFGCSATIAISGLIIIIVMKAWYAPVETIMKEMTGGP